MVNNVDVAREQFLTAGALRTDAVAPDVLNSWRRSRDLQVHPDRVELPYLRDPDTDTPLTHAAAPVLRRIADDLSSQAVSVVLTSADGLVLDRIAADPRIARTLDEVRLARGYSYAEEFAGTNGIGTTLETGQPVFIRGSEHYVGTLGQLACAGSPIRDPVTRRILGVVDLTCWAGNSDPLLFVLAKSAGSQIEDRLRAMNNETETALLDAYLKQTRRYPGGVLAIGGDVVLMNPYLRQSLGSADQAALLDHAAEMARASFRTTAVAALPSGTNVKISAAERISAGVRADNVVFHVALHLAESFPASTGVQSIPRLAGRSSSWRRCCQQVERCYRDRDWVVIEGETGSGRSRLGQSVAQFVTPERTVRILRPVSFGTAEQFVAEFDAETDGDDFAVVIAGVDELTDAALQPLAAAMQSCAGRGWIAATMGTERRSPLVDMLVLPFFTHTVTVPALRHRIEDLEELVPMLLAELTRGADVRMDSAAMRQLSKMAWPGNVAQLRGVLAATVARQRSGVIGVDKLPAACRSLARRKLTQLEALERDAIVRSLAENGGSKADAAEALGMSRATIYRKIKDFGIA
ncbi:siderophore-interacting protein [Mycolicibacterium murale]|jgi:transcriptional regulator of acetoin/glycerol metabolism|uniref:Siderophore-interacting protein n=1 Tax=Mycolicibacterium murale TaxID=182220 RepID=A0A7I9WFB1_9MYCO|nr:helix-turn-helix domain-containing protein [Mycolicibacterium murale]ANW62255.1 siderophore-interacting protein [Mycobacterium sp. djl-10]MCV7182824.1 GAF domain-containing protein [Mycolicibacterium murale]GFG56374.1 siderophore-interacting protein [Mycolicibacterium murale]